MALKIDQNSFKTGQFAGMNPDPLSDFEVRPRLAGKFGSDCQLNGFNLPILDWGWRCSAANYLKDPWSQDRWSPLRVFEPTKNVSREKRLFHLFLSI
jgi:hypothetical protein